MSGHGRQGGFTAYELMLALSVAAIALLALSGVFASSRGLVDDSRVHRLATAAHRRNIEAITNLLRAVDIDTLDGFDAAGVATNPSFSRVIGGDAAGRDYAEEETLEWRASTTPVNGIASPGQVYVVTLSGERMIADRIPAGGFALRLEGRNLVLVLKTYYAPSLQHVVEMSTETSVSLRN